jgi:hypothetical protein
VRRPKKRLRTSAKSKTKHRKLPQNSPPVSRGISAKLGSGPKTANRALTALQETRGRKRALNPETVVEHADYVLKVVASLKHEIAWDKLEAARSKAEAESAIARVPPFYREILRDRLHAILMWVREGKFPRKNLERKMRHLADSIGGDVLISPRRSRDICGEYRKRPVSEQVGMLRCREFYVECTCGYQGPANRGACARCGTRKPSPELLWEMAVATVTAEPDPHDSHVRKPTRRQSWERN